MLKIKPSQFLIYGLLIGAVVGMIFLPYYNLKNIIRMSVYVL